MNGIGNLFRSCCARSSRVAAQTSPFSRTLRYASEKSTTGSPLRADADDANAGSSTESQEQVKGAMTRRLEQMSEESLETGGRGARIAVEEAGAIGFSADLRRQLEQRIADAHFRSDNAAAFSQINMPAGAPKHARESAAATPWNGTETIEDATLRMLNDSHQPLRKTSRSPSSRTVPAHIDTGRPRIKTGAGVRLASAREQASLYSREEKGLVGEERERFRQELRARFQPGAGGHVVASVQGIASLASQRIEDAIARGQFKNLPRGKEIERDHNANSPFIDTTEYFMNKMIKKQEIVPPWIEKQQEVTSAVSAFRKRLRSDWRRHVARVIASRGGSLESQLRLAEEYAYAESIANPSKKQTENTTPVHDQGHAAQMVTSGELQANSPAGGVHREEEMKVFKHSSDADSLPAEPRSSTSPHSRPPTVMPFRDPQWEATEQSYHKLAIQQLNDSTRTYNLMAPDLAKKPYFSLSRELQRCFSDVAPQIRAAIHERALAPKSKGVEVIGHRAGSVLEKFSMDRASQVHDERKPQYGFKEFWRDLFAPKA